jgi:hypothetical protein
VVLGAGIEPARRKAADFKSAVATNYTTRGTKSLFGIVFPECKDKGAEVNRKEHFLSITQVNAEQETWVQFQLHPSRIKQKVHGLPIST